MSLETRCKKLVLVLATSTPVTRTKEKAVETAKTVETAGIGKDGKESVGKYPKNLVQVPYIRYHITFQKNSVPMSALLGSSNEVNAIYLTFAQELGLPIRPTDVGAQKIDNTTLNIYEMVVAAFLVMDKANWVRFFEETFLVANISPKVVFGMLFLTLNGVNVNFSDRELRWRLTSPGRPSRLLDASS